MPLPVDEPCELCVPVEPPMDPNVATPPVPCVLEDVLPALLLPQPTKSATSPTKAILQSTSDFIRAP